MSLTAALETLNATIEGSLFTDDLSKAIYATDASVYRQTPTAVAYPKNSSDIVKIVLFAKDNGISITPRTAGTSLAGQAVGKGIVVDVSKHMNRIVSVDVENKTVTLQPGVVRDELNNFLRPYGLFFGPNTSTSNRCMIGGMVGNNSSGTTSIQYGVTRDKVLELQAVLSDGSQAVFKPMAQNEFIHKTEQNTLEGHIYKTIFEVLKDSGVQNEIRKEFPKPSIHRRNTGYAVDALLDSGVFSSSDIPINLCNLLTGSEGTLAITTQITLQLDDLPPEKSCMVAAHFHSIEACLKAVKPAMQHNLYTCEMMDKTILDCTKHNKAQQTNRQFVQGEPMAILMCEVRANTDEAVQALAKNLVETLRQTTLGYALPVLKEDDIDKAMELRKAGLGLLGSMVGDAKSVPCIEDTAVELNDLANYISEFTKLMGHFGQQAIYYAHAGAGELHLRPILNMKKSEDIERFRSITKAVAKLVKKYKGSLSGEHGDGMLRAEFIPMMIGNKNYEVLKAIKRAFDPENIFNPGKIVLADRMDENLRCVPHRKEPDIQTLIDFSTDMGILRAAEKCNGSGDCRKLPEFGGSMCPSYRATRNEKDTTRARANALREFLTHSDKPNRFDHPELKEVFGLCLSCKACATECPSSVDVAAMKAEFLYQYQKENPPTFRERFFAHAASYCSRASKFSKLSNYLMTNRWTSYMIKKQLGIAEKRSIPKIYGRRLSKQLAQLKNQSTLNEPIKTIYLYIDEFSEFLDVPIGIDTFELLTKLNYRVKTVGHPPSGRAQISKGFLEEAKVLANENIDIFKNLVDDETPLIGIEPSAILSFRDDYLRLADDKKAAQKIAKNTLLIDEFIAREIDAGHIKSEQFTRQEKTIKLHVHCYQKALGNVLDSFKILNLPINYSVTLMPSGCCGMAGSFGYEQEHFEVSMQVGEQTLFPAIRNALEETVIAANGTSCRHQIKDGTKREAWHPIQILNAALLP